MNDRPFIYAEFPLKTPPLGSLLPAVQPGVVRSWLRDHLSPADWLLCPFGSSPQAALEAARAGYRVLTPIHNPILRFLVRQGAAAPSPASLNSALVKLASSYKGKERLKPHILSLYETDCPLCGRTTSARAFLWDSSSREPIQKVCRCSACGEESTLDVTETDREKALAFSDQSPTHARALTRVTSPTDPVRVFVENALATYPPRSVYALFTTLNKITGFSLTEEERSHLEVLLLHAFYRCSQPASLPGNASDEHPNLEREENVWFAMEDALTSWVQDEGPIPLTTWPDTPPAGGGITIFPGRVKDLTGQLIGFPIQGMVMVYPRPTPEFWSLSTLWSGWLWGQETAAPLRGILSSQDLDWPWMTHATRITLEELSEVLPDQIPVLGLMPGVDTQALLSWTSASLAAGLEFKSMAVDPDRLQGQSLWVINPPDTNPRESADHRTLIREAGFEALKESGEPLHTLSLYCAGMSNLARSGYPPAGSQMAQAGEYFSQLCLDFEENIAYRQGFLHYPSIESWWHQEMDLVSLALSDQVEMDLVRALLQKTGGTKDIKLYQGIFDSYPGLTTPRSGLIDACLASYAEQDPDQTSSWRLQKNDLPDRRNKDLAEIEGIITSIGKNLGYQVHRESAPDNIRLLSWGENEEAAEWFYISASGLLGKIITAGGKGPQKGWIILPGSRAGLIHYKLQHNPLLADAIEGTWELIKYRHLRRLAEQGGLTRENFRERFCLDPFTSDSPQLPLI